MVVNGGRNINLVLSYTHNLDVINYSAMAGKAVLICQQNSHSFLDRTLNLEQPVKIGRSVARARAAQNNGIFDCKVLSRNHALFWYANGKFFLQDTKSSNGTFVNNQRLSKSGEESSPREVCSGDIVQFGVDVLENSRKVTHGCIVASLKLYLPDGKEAKASPSTAVLSCVGSVPVEDLYQLNQHIQEALQREQMLQTKLASLQQLVLSLQQASDLSWKALIAEDRLLSRVETLETQLQTYSKNFGEDKLREELRKLNEDKNCYQTTAKECVRKILEEKLEANQKCEDIKIALINTEAECANFKELMEQSHGELRELALKHSAQTAKNEELQDKLQASEDQLKDVTLKLESVKEELNHELQKLVGNEAVLQEQINKLEVTGQLEERQYKIEPKPRSILEQFTAIYDHLPEFNTDETSEDDQDIYLERILDDEAREDPKNMTSRVDCVFEQLVSIYQDQQKTKEVVDILAAQLNLLQGERGAKLQRITALEHELEVHSSQLRTFRNDNVILEHKLKSLQEIVEAEIQTPDSDVTLKPETEEMVAKSTLYNLQAEISELKELLTEARKKSEIAEQKVKVLQIDLDVAKNSLSETTENLTCTKEKLQEAQKIKEERETTVALLKQQMKTLETSRMETTLQEKLEVQHNSINKQEAETLLLRKQLLESQQIAKQHKNEIEQLKEQILVLAEEHEGKLNDDTTDNWENSLDNRAREDFAALQQECSTLKETIKTLESQLLKLKTESRLNQELLETSRNIEEAENESAAMKIDKEISMEVNKEEMEMSRVKISELEEELVLVKERYVLCNEDKTRLEKEYTLMKQDFQGVSQQSSYFNFVCALPLLILFIAFTIAFYPTLSCLFGTTDKPQPPLD